MGHSIVQNCCIFYYHTLFWRLEKEHDTAQYLQEWSCRGSGVQTGFSRVLQLRWTFRQRACWWSVRCSFKNSIHWTLRLTSHLLCFAGLINVWHQLKDKNLWCIFCAHTSCIVLQWMSCSLGIIKTDINHNNDPRQCVTWSLTNAWWCNPWETLALARIKVYVYFQLCCLSLLNVDKAAIWVTAMLQ